jgi:uncharacterized protein (TIGR03435 family)
MKADVAGQKAHSTKTGFRASLLLSEVARVTRTITSASVLVLTLAGAFGQQPAFEVASVKPNKSGDSAPWRFVGSRGGITATNVTLPFLIMNAYGVRENQISGGPSWLSSERYDVVAKDQSDNPSPARHRQMLQTLLADRFQLRLSRETKDLPVYALVVGKGGHKFHEADGGSDGKNTTGRGRITARKVSMEWLSERLGGQLERTVVDRTGLQGNFAFELEWAPDPDDLSGPSVFIALQEQLGLKLEPQKGSVEILVIEHVEKPSEN